jgi:pyridoxine 5-phosphate synthase
VFEEYASAAAAATAQGMGVNAGHDLDLKNLRRFLDIPDILEVSIGHALIVESLAQGLEPVIKQYLAITAGEESETHYY